MSDFWGRADQGQMRPHGRPRSKADVQSTMPGRRYRDLYEGSTMLSRSTGPLGSSLNPAAVKERIEAAMRTHLGQ
jgi:hypothetical protein